KIKRQYGLTATALLGRVAVVLVRQEILTRRQQVRPEPPLGRVRLSEAVVFQQPGEELLRQVLSRLVRMAPAADVAVEREPVELAQFGERPAGLQFIAALGGDNQAPARAGERLRRGHAVFPVLGYSARRLHVRRITAAVQSPA